MSTAARSKRLAETLTDLVDEFAERDTSEPGLDLSPMPRPTSKSPDTFPHSPCVGSLPEGLSGSTLRNGEDTNPESHRRG